VIIVQLRFWHKVRCLTSKFLHPYYHVKQEIHHDSENPAEGHLKSD
jgi:hypothetical protein